MKRKRTIGYFLFIPGAVALGFLVYSVVNRERLAISMTHPRILVEFGLFAGFTVAGVFWLINK
ncbi:MAG: hypothetical protein AAGE93_02305 [Bacteroidota bacterium]